MQFIIKSSQSSLKNALNSKYGVLSIASNTVHTKMFSTTPFNQQDIHSWKNEISKKKKEAVDTITPSQVNLLGNTLDHPKFNYDQFPSQGTELPPAWHLAYFPPRLPEKELSKDGYDTDWSPPEPYTRRMWAGGKLEWDVHNPLRVGDQVRMEACLRDVDIKEEGEAAFVWADYKFHNKYGLALKESRCWVYTNGYQKRKKEVSKITQNKSSSHEVLSNPEFTFNVTPSPITLFRFSALTFNAHLIHYDHTYATEVEKQKGCLTHGPLSLIYMVNQLDQYLATKDVDQSAGGNKPISRKIKSIEYRCLNPLPVNEPITVCGRWKTDSESDPTYDLWITNNSGEIAVKGLAVIDKLK
ncbi:hypothetical protein G6F37_000073 [Rhizopus arrhizus]|nr:hypothetical protein G6F38_000028 [Rhizopus arrhizus]KAG1164684.1 hypothetical protein G6F37_000073 [Rhizopus arrhizus]